MDNDDAGIGAVERLCAGFHIRDLVKKYNNIEVAVASLPSEVKDPAEFVESRSDTPSKTMKECFQTEVIDTAKLWNDWYIDRLISQYNEDDPSGFATVCDDITIFLSKNENPADRTKQAYEVANKLAVYISGKGNDNPSASLRIQLESDLLGMASRKASERVKVTKKIEAVERLEQNEVKLQRMSISDPNQSNNNKMNVSNKRTPSKLQTNGNMMQGNPQTMRKNRKTDYRKQEIPIVQHFNGFTFNPRDAYWLGLSSTHVRIKNILILRFVKMLMCSKNLIFNLFL